nr:acyltransferase superfamily protein [Candidatus Pantoea persica]
MARQQAMPPPGRRRVRFAEAEVRRARLSEAIFIASHSVPSPSRFSPLQFCMSLLHLGSLADVDAAEWDALLPDDQPFLRHAFLLTLEESGSVRAESGWQPDHLLWRENGARRCPATASATRRANMSSSTPGRTPASVPASATIRSGWAPFPFRR